MTIEQQFRAAKAQHPGTLLLFRMGDFFEAFAEDAEIVSRSLGLTLTSRDASFPMCGFPAGHVNAYVAKLLDGGHRVAVLSQIR